jgi:hypothetical protein
MDVLIEQKIYDYVYLFTRHISTKNCSTRKCTLIYQSLSVAEMSGPWTWMKDLSGAILYMDFEYARNQ